MNCIAIDDSANALELIKIHISKIPFLDMIGVFTSAPAALNALNKNDIHLLFIDIHMPEITGLEFVKGLTKKPLVVFTTAYSEYALDGFEVNALDYLLKPISFERFLQTANRAFEYYNRGSSNEGYQMEDNPTDYIHVKQGHEIIRIKIKEIDFLESKGNYLKVQLQSGVSVLTLMTMREALSELESWKFFRCHRSFIIPLNKLESMSLHKVRVNEHVIPVGKSYRREFGELLHDLIKK